MSESGNKKSKSSGNRRPGCDTKVWRRILHRAAAAVSFLSLLLAFAHIARGESPASKNNRGNRLFEQGKYQEAEKAYVAAHADSVDKPEILYNLGNSLIKQKNYSNGIQSLGQSIGKGDKEVREKAWYNTGNAFFSEGRFRESADAFIQALRLNPADPDAKHNLELALLKLKQQEQAKSDEDRKQQDPKGSSEDRDSQPQQSGQDKGRAPREVDGQRESPQPRTAPREGKMTREEALQLLEAVKNQELDEQRRMLERRARVKANGKDW